MFILSLLLLDFFTDIWVSFCACEYRFFQRLIICIDLVFSHDGSIFPHLNFLISWYENFISWNRVVVSLLVLKFLQFASISCFLMLLKVVWSFIEWQSQPFRFQIRYPPYHGLSSLMEKMRSTTVRPSSTSPRPLQPYRDSRASRQEDILFFWSRMASPQGQEGPAILDQKKSISSCWEVRESW